MRVCDVIESLCWAEAARLDGGLGLIRDCRVRVDARGVDGPSPACRVRVDVMLATREITVSDSVGGGESCRAVIERAIRSAFGKARDEIDRIARLHERGGFPMPRVEPFGDHPDGSTDGKRAWR